MHNEINKSLQSSTTRLAIFIDIENFAGYCYEMCLPIDITGMVIELGKLARPVIARSFGDIASFPRDFDKHAIRRMLMKNRVTHYDIPHLFGSKNSADMKLAVDAVATAYLRPDITHFAIVSNDRDFTPLFSHLRELGKIVIGCGPEKSMVREDYSSSCDIFLYLDNDSNKSQSAVLSDINAIAADDFVSLDVDNQQNQIPPSEDTEILLQAILSVQQEGKPCYASAVAVRLGAIFPNFDWRSKYKNFKIFCIYQAKTGCIGITNIDQANFTLFPMPATRTSCGVKLTQPPELNNIDSDSISVINDRPLISQYKMWAKSKLKIDFPLAADRKTVYKLLVDILEKNETVSKSKSLKSITFEIDNEIPGLGDTAFRIIYGLFRCRTFEYENTTDSYDPLIISILVPIDTLDEMFILNVYNTFKSDPFAPVFDQTVWDEFVSA